MDTLVKPVSLRATRLGTLKRALSRTSRRVRLATLGLVAAAAMWPVVSASAAGAQTANYQGNTPVNFSVGLSCGNLSFNGSMHYNQQFTYTPNGQLNFHFVSNTGGTATLNGKTYTWLNNSHEIDHLDIRGTAGLKGFNADGTPNLAPYNGQLTQWLADPNNFSHMDQISLLFNDRLVLPGTGKQLQNQTVISANENGLNAFQFRFVSANLC